MEPGSANIAPSSPAESSSDAAGAAWDVEGVLRAAQSGDQAAWRTLVDRYARRVYALAKSRCKDADVAEEITQSVFATVAAKLADYTEQGRFEPWLFRVAMNRVRDHARRAKHRPRAAEPETLEQHPAPDARPDALTPGGDTARALAALRQGIEQLSEPDRDIIHLRHHAGLSFNQIADLLGEPVGTLLARHHRALKKLRSILSSSRGLPPSILAGLTAGGEP